LFKISAF